MTIKKEMNTTISMLMHSKIKLILEMYLLGISIGSHSEEFFLLMWILKMLLSPLHLKHLKIIFTSKGMIVDCKTPLTRRRIFHGFIDYFFPGKQKIY